MIRLVVIVLTLLSLPFQLLGFVIGLVAISISSGIGVARYLADQAHKRPARKGTEP